MIWKDSDARSQNHGILRFQTGVLEDDRLDALKCLWMKLTSGKPGRLVAQPLPNHGHFSQMELSNATTICRKPQWGGAILLSPSQQAGYFGRRAPCSHEPPESRQQRTRQRTGGTLRVHVTLKLWKPLLESQKFILLVDNYGAQDSLIEGWAAVLHWRKL